MNRGGGPLIHTAYLSETDRKRVLRRYQRGELRRLCAGLYIDRGLSLSFSDQQWRKVRIMAHTLSTPGAVVVGRSAADLWGLPLDTGKENLPVEIAGPHRRSRVSRSRIVRPLPPENEVQVMRTRYGQVRVTTRLRTGVDLARWHTLEDATVFLDHGLRRGLFSREDLCAGVARVAGSPGAPAARQAERLATGTSESPRESSLKVRMWRAGLPAPVQQVNIYDERGDFIARVDFFFPGIGLAVEYDGEGKHRGAFGLDPETALRDTMERQNELLNAGVVLVRIDRDNYRDGSGLAVGGRRHRHLSRAGYRLPDRQWFSEAGPAWR